MRYFLEIAYNGSEFHGWQSQPNAVSVQSQIEEALSKILRENITIVGAGRTDTGVHARQTFAHFDSSLPIIDYKRFLTSINGMIGKDIFIKKIIEREPNDHARFDAIERSYKYFITYTRNPFLHDFCWFSHTHLNIEAMNEAADILTKVDDFTSFAKLHSDAKTNICDVVKAKWLPFNEDAEARNFLGTLDNGIVFTITADRFLRNMVRAVVGTLVDVGRNKISIDRFKEIIHKKDRCSAGTSMPGNALFLWEVKYPYLNRKGTDWKIKS